MEVLKNANNKAPTIGVIGLGYVGLPLALEFSLNGFDVIGMDINFDKVMKLKMGESLLGNDISTKLQLCLSSNSNTIFFTTEYSMISKCEAIIICVPTPLNEMREPDLSYLEDAVSNIRKHVRKNSLIVLESTSYPGTTEDLLLSKFSDDGYIIGKDLYLCYSPERIDPGTLNNNITHIPKVIGGVTPKCLERGINLYKAIVLKLIPVTSTKTAEMTKLLENTFRSVNIAFINEFALLCEKIGVNIWEVIKAASTKPYGFMSFYPGPGVGGHCIPVDPVFLSWRAKHHNFFSEFIEISQEINRAMPNYVVQKITEALNRNMKCINGSKLLLLGMTYKPNIADYRESPSIEIYEMLNYLGAKITVNEPNIDLIYDKKGNIIENKELSYHELANYDCIVILTAHSVYQPELIVKYADLIVDTRNLLDGYIDDKIVLLGAPDKNFDLKKLVAI
ncbi:nucleotide sugar dehydrogenase [Paenibacillus sp. IITD108]|uniref:nucleotide sugar dehydrogenase n=1 Tax=Paenibacillus sp. IITD108 TaxID=3116649 RepID=UPI002F417E21